MKTAIGLIGAQSQIFILFYFFNIFVELEETIEVYGKVNDCGGPFLRFGLDAHAILRPYDSEIRESRLT